jgi:S-adenosylmethionine hydrolase
MNARLLKEAPAAQIVSLFADAPTFNPRASAYLLAAYADEFPAGTVFLCIVDPGKGSDRPPVIVEAEDKWYVGPGNGLFELVRRKAAISCIWEINWRPDELSASFHGRDLFAPVAAALENGKPSGEIEREPDRNRFSYWPDQLLEIVYIDCYVNALTGLSADCVNTQFDLLVNNLFVSHGRTFSDVSQGVHFGM